MNKNHDESTHLSPSEKKALYYILENGPTYAYYLSHATPKILETEKTANIALNSLSRKGLLKKRAGNGVREKKIYSLTLKGLCKALADSASTDKIWENFENVIANNGSLIPVLAKFEVFKKHNLHEDFKQRLRKAAIDTVNQRYMLGITGATGDPYWGLSHLMGVFISDLLAFINFKIDLKIKYTHAAFGAGEKRQHEDDLRLSWAQVLREDDYLRQLAKDYTEQRLNELDTELEIQKARISILQSLESDEPDWEAIRSGESGCEKANRE